MSQPSFWSERLVEGNLTNLVGSVFHAILEGEESERAFVHALAIALVEKASLTLFCSEKKSRKEDHRAQAVRATLERWQLLEPGSDRATVRDQLAVSVQKLRPSGDPTRSCLTAIGKKYPDLVVMATKPQRGITSWRRNSLAAQVGLEANLAVLYVPDAVRGFVNPLDGHLTLRRILIPTSDVTSPEDQLVWGKWIAEALGDAPVSIQMLGVNASSPLPKIRDSKAWTIQALTRRGRPLDQTLEAAKEADLMIIPAPNASLDRFSSALMHNAPCPVLAIPSVIG